MPSPAEVGAVVIGRNEGERLLRCLDATHRRTFNERIEPDD